MAAVRELAGRRFGALLAQPPAAPSAAPITRRRCIVFIDGGAHRGARFLLAEPPVSIGSAPDNDVVLRDAGVRPHHADLRRVDGAWGLYVAGGTQPFPAVESLQRGRMCRERHGVGAASLIISQCKVAQPAQASEGSGLKQALAKASAAGTLVWARMQRLVAPMLFAAATVIGTVVIFQFARPAEALARAGTHPLVGEGWPDVRVEVDAEHGTRVVGNVDDAAALQRLRVWLPLNGLGGAPIQVRVGSELVMRVREALTDPALNATYVHGTVRVEGTTARLATRDDLRRLKADLAGVVEIEDRVAYVETPPAPRTRVLPVRITTVIPGENGSFATDTGQRYFIGGVLPDGAEVLAVEADQVVFRVGETTMVYPLK